MRLSLSKSKATPQTLNQAIRGELTVDGFRSSGTSPTVGRGFAFSGGSPPAEIPTTIPVSPLDNPTEFETFAQCVRDLHAILHRLIPTEKECTTMDILIQDHGSIVLLVPETDAGRAWVEDNVSRDGWQPDWPTVFAEPRYVTEIVLGTRRDRLQVEEGY